MQKILIDIKEFTELTGIGDDKARELARRDDFPKIRVGNRTKIIVKELDKWFMDRKGEIFWCVKNLRNIESKSDRSLITVDLYMKSTE